MTTKRIDSYLSSAITVSKYREMVQLKDVKRIVAFLKERFEGRYIAPFENNKKKNGFIMMAASCLMIEALESFWQGWEKTPNSALAFCQFFERNSRFDQLRGYSQEFYKNVRCGIIHQGETTGAWHVRRDLKSLFDKSTKTIDATRFLKEVKGALHDYCSELEKEAWDSGVWKNFRNKMKNICNNSEKKT